MPPKAKKVYTPGSKPPARSPGRPKKLAKRLKQGRKNNYRHKYTPELFAAAVKAVRDGTMSFGEASKHFGVPKTTLHDRINSKATEDLGRPTELSKDEEELVVERLQVMGEWGFPLTTKDLVLFIRDYLNHVGKTTRFTNNTPGKFFVKGFLKRHRTLTIRKANFIKRVRAALSHSDVNDFFVRFEQVVKDIDPDCIYNYDETNLQDNAGERKAIFRRGVKYAELIRDSTKSAITVMFAGTASGRLLPPYVIYKGLNFYPSWGQGGPKGTVYTVTKNGWIDMHSFEDWFVKVVLPDAQKRPGKKLLIGDNHSSHINHHVIDLCKQNQIEFVCLPPNATDKMQPLDVGFFHQMKVIWRDTLTKITDEDPTAKVLRKTEFPKLLKDLVGKLNPGQHLPKEQKFTYCTAVPVPVYR